MNELYRDLLIGVVFMIGLLGFISGEFILSSIFFASSAIASHISLGRKKAKTENMVCE